MTAPVTGNTSPAGANVTYTANQIADVAIKAGFPRDQVPTAIAVALAESGGKLNAFNNRPPDLSYGLWQINMYGPLGEPRRRQFGINSNEALFGSQINANAAKKVWDGQGWGGWSTYKDGKYRAFMVVAVLAAQNPTGTADVTPGEGDVITEIGGKIPDAIRDFVLFILKSLGPFFLRTAGFVGGGILVIVAIVLYVRSQNK